MKLIILVFWPGIVLSDKSITFVFHYPIFRMPSQHSFLQDLLAAAEPKSIERNGFLIKEGQVEQHFYLIKTGAVRVFLLTEFEEMTIRFGYEGSLITSLSSFLNGTPSEFYIQAIRNTTYGAVSKKEFESFIGQSASHLQWYNELLKGLVSEQMEREIDLLTFSPAERLRRVRERSPQLFQEIPSKYIASYLRMTPETLSRLRKS